MKKIILSLLNISVFLIPFYIFRVSFSIIKTNVFEIAVFLCAIFALVFFLREKKKWQFGSIWFYIFLLGSAVAVFFSPDLVKAIGIYKGWFLVPVVLSVTIINLYNKRDVFKLIWPLYLSTIVVSIWAILQRLGIFGKLFYQTNDASFDQYLSQGRAFGPFESPNALAMFLVPSLFLILLIWPKIKEASIKALFIASLILPLSAIYFSSSKGGFLALILSGLIGLFVYLFASFKTAGKRILIGAIMVSLLAIIFIFSNRFIDLNSGSNNIRREIYSYSLQMIRDHPIAGIGVGNFQKTIDEYSKDSRSFQEWGMPYAIHPHNVFLAFWLNMGIIGLLAFLSVLTQIFSYLYQMKDFFAKGLLIGSMAAITIHGLIDTTYFKNDLSTIFWLIFAIPFIFKRDEKTTSV